MIDIDAFEAECRADIPLLDAMQLRFTGYSNQHLTLRAPLAPNINNKGTAFGGSIASICLFAGWAVATLNFIEAGIDNAEVVVFSNTMTFEKPARGTLDADARLDLESFQTCLDRLHVGDTGRHRFDVVVELFNDGHRCAVMTGVYVAWLK